MKISDLNPNSKNPRKITDKRLAMLKESITRFGDLSGFVFNRRSSTLISGHQRQKTIPPDCPIKIEKRYDEPTKSRTVAEGHVIIDGERFKYREVDAEPVWEVEAMLAANKHGGEWDQDILKDIIANTPNINVEWAGFEVPDLEPMNIEVPEYNPEIPQEDLQKVQKDEEEDVPQPPKEPISKPGDLYKLGDHRLLCGDATKIEDVQRLMGEERADMVWTDPPYNVAYNQGKADALTIINDNMSGTDFLKFLTDAHTNMFFAVKPGGAIYVAHADTEGLNFRWALIESGFLMKQCLIWVKQSLVMGRQDYHWQHEPILYGWKPGASHSWFGDRKQTTILHFDRPFKNTEHPTMKPLALIEYCLNNSCPPKGLVFDPFLGSGSTLMAAERAHRRCFGLELDPGYVDVIVERYEKLTGKKAEKLS